MTAPLTRPDLTDQIARRVEDMARLNRALEAARRRIGNARLSAVLGDGILICDYNFGQPRNKYDTRVRDIYAHFDNDEAEEAIKFVESL